MSTLQLREVSKRFGGVVAAERLNIEVPPGRITGLIGPNGAGKSTFLKCVANIHRPTGGRLLVARRARISSMIELGVGFQPELT